METTKPTLAAAQPDAARATLFRNVYLWMTMALALTALTAYTVAGSETLLQAIFSSRFVFLGLIVAELVLVFVLAANIMRMSFLTATLMFIAYSVVNGATLSTIFLVYDLGSIGLTFLVTAGMFGAMSLYGFVTGRDLSSWGNLLTMALVAILASVVNLFLRSEMLMWIVTYVGILLFVGLTAYDTQTIKRMIYSGAEVDEPMQKMALLGALSLYLDFINLFLYMLAGGRRQPPVGRSTLRKTTISSSRAQSNLLELPRREMEEKNQRTCFRSKPTFRAAPSCARRRAAG